jgi:hypothetical protein
MGEKSEKGSHENIYSTRENIVLINSMSLFFSMCTHINFVTAFHERKDTHKVH